MGEGGWGIRLRRFASSDRRSKSPGVERSGLDVQTRPVTIGGEAGQSGATLKVDLAVRIGSTIAVVGWCTQRVTLGLRSAGVPLESTEIAIERPDVSRQFPVPEGIDPGFVLLATSPSGEVTLEWTDETSSFESLPLRIEESADPAHDRALAPAWAALALAEAPHSQTWRNLVGRIVPAKERTDQARGILDGVSEQAGRGLVVTGWVVQRPGSVVWLEDEAGQTYSLDDATRRFRRDVYDAVRDEFGPWADSAGFVAVLPEQSGQAVITLRVLTSRGVHILGEPARVTSRLGGRLPFEPAPAQSTSRFEAPMKAPVLRGGLVEEVASAAFTLGPVDLGGALEDIAVELARLGLVQGDWYAARHPEMREGALDPVMYYLQHGDREGHDPNPYFRTRWYRERYLGGDTERSCLLHYLRSGERTGHRPSPVFDPVWYAANYGLKADRESILGHYLLHRFTHRFAPNRYFSPEYYRRVYEDVAHADIDTFEHWMNWGIFEHRDPSGHFSADFVWRTYLEDDRSRHAFDVFMDVGEDLGWKPTGSGTADGAAVESVTPHGLLKLAGELVRTGLIQVDWYVGKHPEVVEWGGDPALHYLLHGERNGFRPNPYFDPIWYAKKHFGHAPSPGSLAHYFQKGEREGKRPCAVFDVEWYAATYALDASQTNLLAHYLENRGTHRFAPNRYFSPAFYRDAYPDVAAAGVDPFEHWMTWGIFERRRPSELFNAEVVWQRYLGNNRSLHAFEVFMDLGEALGWAPTTNRDFPSVHAEIRKNCAQGPLFEPFAPANKIAPHTKVLAYYLPQFHPIEENNAWWGEGFTEWNNVPRGTPRFVGHYQPRIPRDLGFYELRGTDVLRRQVDLAKRSGIHGFCFYYYNFNGHRLLERPLDEFVADSEIDFPFTLMWANENWTRRWDGMEKDVLMRQDYRPEDLPALVDDLARYLKHPSYIKIDGRPLLFLYRADVIPDTPQFIEEWRAAFKTRHDLEPILVMAQAFGVTDPAPFGFDGAIEFPPHKLGNHLPELNHELDLLDPDFSGSVRSFEDAVDRALSDSDHPYPLIRTAFPQWDNDARKQGGGMCFHGSTPALFQKWVAGLVEYAHRRPFFGEHFVCINAWNEWCEGAYLEPDTHFGHAYLNALSRAVTQPIRPAQSRERVVLVGHDAFPAGAQQLLLNLGRVLTRQFGVEVSFVLMGDGDLVSQYEQVAETYVVTRNQDVWGGLNAHVASLYSRGFRKVLTNSVVSGAGAAAFARASFRVCSLIHELPTLVKDRSLDQLYEAIRDSSDTVVFPSTFVRDAIVAELGEPRNETLVRPQGLYKNLVAAEGAHEQVRRALGLGETDRIVLNVGYADLRKGIDLFAAVAALVNKTRPDVHFVWVGDQDPGLSTWIRHDSTRRSAQNLHFVAFTEEVGTYMAAADLFFLSSREDPFPSVVLEALAMGLPVAGFEGASGCTDLLADERLGILIPYLDLDAASRAVVQVLNAPEAEVSERAGYRRTLVAREYDFPDYCADLLAKLYSSRRRVSVIVPNYNYARYLEERLTSIFNQTYPIFELIVLDDASTDDSLDTARACANRSGRIVQLVANEKNSGNVFRQWRRGLERARGDLVWIAEADDAAAPEFLAELVASLDSSASSRFAFCDSRAIGPSGETIYESYKGYYSSHGDHGLDEDATFEGIDFVRRFLAVRNCVLNASSVLWRRSVLLETLDRLGEDAFALSCAGDWRIYLEAARQGGTVHYVSAQRNFHRRHASSVTHALQHEKHFEEIASLHRQVQSVFHGDTELAELIGSEQQRLANEWSLRSQGH